MLAEWHLCVPWNVQLQPAGLPLEQFSVTYIVLHVMNLAWGNIKCSAMLCKHRVTLDAPSQAARILSLPLKGLCANNAVNMQVFPIPLPQGKKGQWPDHCNQ
jgi:hypothetical protein